MKIQFEPKDETPFFNMISVYGFYAEIEEKCGKELEPKFSEIDIILLKVSEIVAKFHFYEANFEPENPIYISQFLLATGRFMGFEDVIQRFEMAVPNSYFKIDKNKLWQYLLKEGLW